MRMVFVAASIAVATLGGCATSNTPAPAAAVVPPPVPAAPAVPARTAAQIKMDELIDEPKKNAIFQKYAPAVATHPQISMARGMTLADVAGYAEAGLTPEILKAIVDEVNKL
jgi:hypothetical protein